MNNYSINVFAAIMSSGLMMTMAIGMYLIQAFAYYKIAEKAQLGNRWLAFIPGLQYVIVLHTIDKSAWNLLLLFIPIVNIVFMIMWLYKFMRSFGVEPILAILSFLIPIVQSVLVLYIGYSNNFQYRASNRYQESH